MGMNRFGVRQEKQQFCVIVIITTDESYGMDHGAPSEQNQIHSIIRPNYFIHSISMSVSTFYFSVGFLSFSFFLFGVRSL